MAIQYNWIEARLRIMLLEKLSHGVAAITLDFPPANAIGPAQITQLDEALTQAAADPACRALVIRAKGRFFCAGADIRIMHGAAGEAVGAVANRLAGFARQLQILYAKLEAFPAPSIAAINGITIGGGLELALACDFRVAAADATLGLAETKLGLIPGAGGTQRMVSVLGRARASDLILRARLITGEEAARIGLVHEAVPGDNTQTQARALALAEELAALPQAALREAKRCMALAVSDQGYAAEIEATRALQGDAETQALIGAFLARSSKSRT